MYKSNISLNRRSFLKTVLGGAAAFYVHCNNKKEKLFLIRYDTESRQKELMKGFFEKMVSVHRNYHIPASFFCLGAAIEKREAEFREFYQEIKDDPLFDIQDHSYSHIGLGYQNGKSIDLLREDYEKSFAAHERVFSKRPIGVSMCGTGGKDGPNLCGFDATEKSRAELHMLAQLGVKMINTFLCGVNGKKEFINYTKIAHPEIMGFPTAPSTDNSWLRGRRFGDPIEYMVSQIKERASRGEHMVVVFHDDTVWIDVADKELKHIQIITDTARKCGYKLVTHVECYKKKSLWNV